MAYTINLTNGTVFAVVQDGTINTSSSITLVGKNYAGYGEFLDENFIHMLENFSNATPPGTPLTGQLWYDNSTSTLNAYNGETWKSLPSSTSSTTTPTNNVIGDLWFDTLNQQLKVYNGTAFIVVGPGYSSAQGVSGAVPISINDSGGTPHIVTGIYANNELVSIVNPGTTFVPAAPFNTSFPTVYRGTTVWNSGYQSGNIAALTTFTVTVGSTNVLTVNSAGGNLVGTLTANVINTNSITNSGANGTGNIGSASTYYNTVFAKATSAQYADLAERFESDTAYEPGTVVEIGGEKEITAVTRELSDEVFGVISTQAAYLMNGAAGSNETHPAVAVAGRVPVKVTGPVRKGQRLVSAGRGIARAAIKSEITPFNVIGRALSHKTTDDVGVIEAIVTIKN